MNDIVEQCEHAMVKSVRGWIRSGQRHIVNLCNPFDVFCNDDEQKTRIDMSSEFVAAICNRNSDDLITAPQPHLTCLHPAWESREGHVMHCIPDTRLANTEDIVCLGTVQQTTLQCFKRSYT